MCVIIIKQKKSLRLPEKVLNAAAQQNPHGLGIVWLDTYEIGYYDSKDYQILNCNRPFIAHFRFASVGRVCVANIHPFRCGNNPNEWLMMNGTIFNMGDSERTDTEVLANKLGSIPRHLWKDELDKFNCRFVTINTLNHSFQIYNHALWTQKNGIWYSKEQVLQDNIVAVYGTLKVGQANYHMLGTSTYLGKGRSREKYPLVSFGIPYLFDRVGEGHRIWMDVFKVSDEKLEALDFFEGHPHHYHRKQIRVRLTNKKTILCWVYFASRDIDISKSELLNNYPKSITETKKKKGKKSKGLTKTLSAPVELFSDIKSEYGYDDYDEYDFKGLNELCLEGDDEISIEDEKPMCPDCFNDVEFDGFNNFYCRSCGSWFRIDEVKRFMA